MGSYTFFPPTVDDVPPLEADTKGPALGLFRHYRTRPRGENVWELVDGTYTTTQPYPTISVEDAHLQSSNAPATYRKVFWGGHDYGCAVDEAEAIALQAAGVAVLDVNLFPCRGGPPPNVLLTSDGRFILLDSGDAAITTSFAPNVPVENYVLTSDGYVIFLVGTRDAIVVDP